MAARRDNDDHGSGIVRTSARKPQPEREAQKTTEPESTTVRATKLSTAEVVKSGLQQVADLTGKEVIGVTSVKALEDGWLVDVEAIEDRRVPSSGDLLAVYEAQLAADGALLGYRRKKRYSRGWGDKGDAL